MSKRCRPRSGSTLLKFSTSSVSSARANHARNHQQQQTVTDGGPTTSANSVYKRRKIFNTSTELFHVFTLIVMSVCRRITSQCYLQRRLIFYIGLVFVGGILKDFASTFIRAFIFRLPNTHLFNWLFVKFGWAWNLTLLVPLVSLSSELIQLVDNIMFDEIEQSIEDYHENNRKQWPQSADQGTSSSKPAVSSQSVSIVSQSKLIDQYKQQLLDGEFRRGNSRFTWKWFQQVIVGWIRTLWIRDIYRLVLCSAFYLSSIFLFRSIHSITAARGGKNVANPGNALANVADSNVEPASFGFDISGHVFILIFSNLIFIEECNIMTKWEPLGDRLFGLSHECMNIEMNNKIGPYGQPVIFNNHSSALFWSKINESLFLAWYRYHQNSNKLRLVFCFSTILTLLWDFMLLQTALFYHSLIEKLFALVWAILCWYIAYHCLFPLLKLQVRKVTTFQS